MVGWGYFLSSLSLRASAHFLFCAPSAQNFFSNRAVSTLYRLIWKVRQYGLRVCALRAVAFDREDYGSDTREGPVLCTVPSSSIRMTCS